MSLDWDCSKIKYFQNPENELHIESVENGHKFYEMNPRTKTIIFSTMAVAIGNLTESNAKLFYGRWKVLEETIDLCVTQSFVETMSEIDKILYDSLRLETSDEKIPVSKIVKHYITVKDVKDHIGLVTNVSFVNNTEWLERIFKTQKIKHFELKNRFMEMKELKNTLAYHTDCYSNGKGI